MTVNGRNLQPVSLWIGCDYTSFGQSLANLVCERSAAAHIDHSMTIQRLNVDELAKMGYMRTDPLASTQFTYTRFLVPYLCNYTGYAVFCDNDFVWESDPMELIRKYTDPTKAVSCVKHQYSQCPSSSKMNGVPQVWYPRKNWSSMMVFNCAHPSCRNLTLDAINTRPAAWLHRMEWCSDDEIQSVPHEYNYLVGYYHDRVPKAIHYTDGGPWYKDYQNVEFATNWYRWTTEDERSHLASIF